MQLSSLFYFIFNFFVFKYAVFTFCGEQSRYQKFSKKQVFKGKTKYFVDLKNSFWIIATLKGVLTSFVRIYYSSESCEIEKA